MPKTIDHRAVDAVEDPPDDQHRDRGREAPGISAMPVSNAVKPSIVWKKSGKISAVPNRPKPMMIAEERADRERSELKDRQIDDRMPVAQRLDDEQHERDDRDDRQDAIVCD